MMASRATINRTAIMTIAASRVTRTSITTINIMTREEPKADMLRMAMGLFHPHCSLPGGG